MRRDSTMRKLNTQIKHARYNVQSNFPNPFLSFQKEAKKNLSRRRIWEIPQKREILWNIENSPLRSFPIIYLSEAMQTN